MFKKLLILSCTTITVSAFAMNEASKVANELLYSDKEIERVITYCIAHYFQDADNNRKDAIRKKAYASAKKSFKSLLGKSLEECLQEGKIEQWRIKEMLKSSGTYAAHHKIEKEAQREEFVKIEMQKVIETANKMGQLMQTVIEKACKAFPDSDQE